MSEVTLSIGERKVLWEVPDEVGIVLLSSFIQVCGPAKSDVETKVSQSWVTPPRPNFDSGYSDQEASAIVAGARTPSPGAVSETGVGTDNHVYTKQELLDGLLALQHNLCAYGTNEGDGGTCDCKYDLNLEAFGGPAFTSRHEVTGCPEMRAAIRVLGKLIELAAEADV